MESHRLKRHSSLDEAKQSSSNIVLAIKLVSLKSLCDSIGADDLNTIDGFCPISIIAMAFAKDVGLWGWGNIDANTKETLISELIESEEYDWVFFSKENVQVLDLPNYTM